MAGNIFDFLPTFWTKDSLRRELDRAASLLLYLTTRVRESNAPAEVKAPVFDFAVRYGEWARFAEEIVGSYTTGALETNKYGEELRGWLREMGEVGAAVDGKNGIDLTLPPDPGDGGGGGIGFGVFAVVILAVVAFAYSRR